MFRTAATTMKTMARTTFVTAPNPAMTLRVQPRSAAAIVHQTIGRPKYAKMKDTAMTPSASPIMAIPKRLF